MKRVSDCVHCKCEVSLPDELYQAAIRSHKVTFCCAYGHSQHFSEDGIRKYWAQLANQAVRELPNNVVQFRKKPR